MGNSASASGSSAAAYGDIATASGANSTGIGKSAAAQSDNSTALGNAAQATNTSATALGDSAAASGANSLSAGKSATASAESANALGNSSNASGSYASALGAGSKAGGTYANALGASSNASGAYSFAEGKDSKASGYSSTAIGNVATATDQQAVAVGLSATASGRRSIAIGAPSEQSPASTSTNDSDRITKDATLGTKASAPDAMAIGSGAQATAQYATALGTNTAASNKNTIALGKNAAASGLSAVSIGYDAKGIGNYTVTIGEDSSAKGDFGAAVGNYASASGAQSFAGGYKAAASQANAAAVGANALASGASSTALGTSAAASGESSLAAGSSANASGVNSTSVGAGSQASGDSATSLGRNARGEGSHALAAGYNAAASDVSAIALGDSSAASKQNALAVGQGAQATETGAMALGQGANAAETDTVAIGNTSTASGESAIALGKGTKSSVTSGVALGEGANANRAGLGGSNEAFSGTSVASTKGAVSVGSTDNERQIVNVAGGTQDTDAVNVRQLKYVGNAVVTSLGGGAAFDASSGTYTAPTYTNNNKSFNNVADALSDVNSGAVKYERGSDGSINKDKATLEGGSNGTTLDNVANGTVSSSSKQAINGSQLYGTSSSVANALGGGSAVNPDGTVSNPSYTVHNADGTTTNAGNVGDAITNVDNRTAGNTTAINDINSGKTGLTQQAAAGEKITVGKDTDGTEVSFADKNSGTRKLTNVTAGAIASNSTDAVNGGQLYTEQVQRRTADNGLATALGGGAAVADDGTVTAPTYTNNNKSFNNVAEALSDVNSGAVKYERGSDGSINKDKATLEGGSNGTTLDNVANGTVSSSSKQAINGSQLYGTSSSVANALGGGSTVNPDGTVSNPSYTVHNTDGTTTNAGNVGDAITNVDNRTAGNTTAINDINSGKTGLTQQAAAGDKITVGKDTDGTEVSFADKNSGTRKLTNVMAGAIASNSTDAVNGGQLYTEQAQRRTADNGLATALGGGAAVADDGSVTAPTYTNNNKSFNNVADALSDVNSGAVKYERGSDGSINKDKATLEGGSNGTTLDNVANGTVSSSSKQAINGSQLYGTSSSVANALGGGSTVNPDGTVSNPSYTVHNADGTTTNAGNVGDAITNVDNRTAGNTTAINDINSGKTGLTQQAAAGEKITVGKDTDGTEVSFADKNNVARKLTNVAAGTIASESTDAINGSQLYASNESLANALGGGSTLNPDGTVTKPTYANNGTTYNNIGDALKDVNDGAVKYNRNSDGTIDKSKASLEGGDAGTTLDNVAPGSVAADSKQAVNGSQLHSEQTQRQTADTGLANALGGGSKVADDGTVTNPTYTVHNADGSTTTANNVGDALTNVDTRTAGNTDAINNINSGKTGLVQQESAGKPITVAKDTDGTEVTFADKDGKTRTLTNVSAGKVSSDSVDAINGSQLYGTSSSVANALGGGSTVNPDGTVSNPSYTVHNADGSTTTANNVGDAITNVDNRTAGNTDAINNINSGKTGLTQQAAAGEKITVGKDTDGTEVSFADKNNGTRKLTNVTAGAIASNSTDAVNGGQLYTEQAQRRTADNGLATALGGGAAVADDGTVTAPTYTNNNKSFNNVADALSDVNSGAVKYERGSDGSINKDKATLEGGSNGTTLDNVANGTVSSSSKQAVNGSQLYSEQTQRQTADTGLANALGGGSKVADDGTVTNPTYTVHNADGSTTTANNVGDALTNVDTRTAGNTDAINNINSGKTGLVQQESAGKPITVAKDTDGTEVTFADKDGKTRTLTNVSAGKVSSDSVDAINGSQLYAGNQSIANALGGGSTVNPDGTVSHPSYTVHNADGSTTTANNVGDAITNVDNRTAGNTTAINDINSGKTGLTQQAAAGEKITVGKDTDGTEVSFADKNNAARKLTNVAAGTIASESTDAINGSQLYASNESLANALGGGSTLNPDGTVTKPTYANNGTTYNNIGDALKDVNDGAVKYNRNSDGTIDKSKASLEGGDAGTTLDNVAPGSVAADSKQAVNGSQLHSEQTQRQTADTGLANALGGGSKVADDGTVTNPTYTVHNADGSTTTASNVGDALTNVDNRTAGNTDAINNINSGKTGLVQQESAGKPITVAKDTDGTEVTFADKDGKTRTLTNVSAGKVSSDSVDAINGSQLYGTSSSVANALGGGSTVNPDGTVSNPSYTVHNADGTTTNAGNVGDAITNVDSRTAGNTDAINNINSGKTGLTQQAAAGEKITVGKDTDGTEVSFADKDKNARKLTNVAAGTIASESKDAINGSQLYASNESLANALGGGSTLNPDGTVTKPTYANNGTTYNNIGDALKDVNDGAVKYNRNSDGTIDKSKASLEGGDAGTTLDNVAPGSVAADSKQAVNGSQLHSEQTQRQTADTGLANALGGGSKVADDGTVTNPTYTVHNADGSTTTANNVGDALTNVDTRTAGNTDAINNINSGKTGLVQQESAGKPITVAKDTDGTEVTFADKDGKTRTLTNVSAGKVSSDSVDAINGSQLYAGNQSIANALGGGSTLNSDGTVTAPSYQLHTYNQHSGEQPAVTYSNVGEALSNVDGRTITNTDQIREIAARVNPAGEYGYSVNGRNFDRVEEAMRDIDAGAVKYDRNADGTINTSKASLEGGDKGTVLDNVANGAVTADSKQAVNGSQLYATNQAISDITGGKTGLTQQAAAGEKITVGKDTDGTEVSFADKNGGTRTLTSVSDGSVSATSKEAVNGSQLHSEQTQRQTADTGLANALGGGASVADNGTVTAPSYTLHNADGSTTTANNVGGALTNLDDRTVNNTNAINQMASGKSGLVQQESNDATITVGKDSNGKTVTFADKDGNARKLMQVANGDINSTSQDAINGSQLHASNMSIANSLGGGSTVNADGTLSVPVYTLNGKQYVGVDQALQGLGQSTASNSDSGSSSATGDHSSATGAGSNASGTGATANGDKASATGNGSTAGGANSVASNTNSTALGNGAKATGENASATGAGASAGGKESTATGANSSAKGDYATASGVNAQASGTGSTASGHGAKATSDNSSAFGRDAVASGTGSTAGGNAAKASGDGSTAYGQNATASGSQSAAFGQNATADGQNSVALGAGSSTDGRDNTVSVGSAGSERAISNVADGTQAHDAATVGQMSRGFSAMDHRIDKVERHAKAGTASAMAMTGLPQAVLPGRSMMSAAGGTFEGQSAVAVGLSTMTDNGRWIIKGQVSGNTQGEVGGAVGVGYQW